MRLLTITVDYDGLDVTTTLKSEPHPELGGLMPHIQEKWVDVASGEDVSGLAHLVNASLAHAGLLCDHRLRAHAIRNEFPQAMLWGGPVGAEDTHDH